MFQRLKSFFQRKPSPKFQHPEFGELIFTFATWEGTTRCGIWEGTTHRGDRRIRFMLAGTETAPAPSLLDGLRDLLTRFEEAEHAATGFITTQEPDVEPGEFQFYSCDFLWPEEPTSFAMEFLFRGDDTVVWRVQFKDGQPFFVGQED